MIVYLSIKSSPS